MIRAIVIWIGLLMLLGGGVAAAVLWEGWPLIVSLVGILLAFGAE